MQVAVAFTPLFHRRVLEVLEEEASGGAACVRILDTKAVPTRLTRPSSGGGWSVFEPPDDEEGTPQGGMPVVQPRKWAFARQCGTPQHVAFRKGGLDELLDSPEWLIETTRSLMAGHYQQAVVLDGERVMCVGLRQRMRVRLGGMPDDERRTEYLSSKTRAAMTNAGADTSKRVAFLNMLGFRIHTFEDVDSAFFVMKPSSVRVSEPSEGAAPLGTAPLLLLAAASALCCCCAAHRALQGGRKAPRI